MSDRERWTIYPLLFFALILAARGQCNQDVEARFHRIVCDQLVVQSPQGDEQIHLYSANGGGRVVVYGQAGKQLASMEADAIASEGRLRIGSVDGQETRVQGIQAHIPQINSDHLKITASKYPQDTEIVSPQLRRFGREPVIELSSRDGAGVVRIQGSDEIWGRVITEPEPEEDEEIDAAETEDEPVDSAGGTGNETDDESL